MFHFGLNEDKLYALKKNVPVALAATSALLISYLRQHKKIVVKGENGRLHVDIWSIILKDRSEKVRVGSCD